MSASTSIVSRLITSLSRTALQKDYRVSTATAVINGFALPNTIPLNIAEGNGKQSLKDKNRFFDIARCSALECASMQGVRRVCDAFDDESNRQGKSKRKRIVSMLTRLVQRTHTVAEGAIAYEYEYRDTEYEYEENSQNQAFHASSGGGSTLQKYSHPGTT